MTTSDAFQVKSLGPCQIDSPLATSERAAHGVFFVDDDDRILLEDRVKAGVASPEQAALLERAGPRRKIFFRPEATTVGIVTCGGLCPGLNDVIRGLVMVSHYRYGVRRILGFRYGYRGVAHTDPPPLELTPDSVADIHQQGGTLLGSSRGHQEPSRMVDRLQELGVSVLFVIGGDGTMRGGLAIAEEVERRGLKIAIVGVPKTIDNDLGHIDRSFGFETAFSTAMKVIDAAHNEARGAPNGVALVKLMGRHSRFIACHATLASGQVNFTLVPEAPLELEGPKGLLPALQRRLAERRHAVIVVAEGAGQDLVGVDETKRDASGNVKLKDIGPFLAERIKEYFARVGVEITLRYIDPSYVIRSVPATPSDSVFCWRLAQNAVHGAMCGKTEMLIGSWHNHFVYLPMEQATSQRKQLDPQGELWLSMVESTGQPM